MKDCRNVQEELQGWAIPHPVADQPLYKWFVRLERKRKQLVRPKFEGLPVGCHHHDEAVVRQRVVVGPGGTELTVTMAFPTTEART